MLYAHCDKLAEWLSTVVSIINKVHTQQQHPSLSSYTVPHKVVGADFHKKVSSSLELPESLYNTVYDT